MCNAAVIDIGSARIKATIVTEKANYSLKDETNLSKYVDEGGFLNENFVRTKLTSLLDEFVNKIISYGNGRILTLGTHTLRNIKNSEYVKNEIIMHTGNCNIIDGSLEGALFYSWMEEKYALSNAVVLDIGGGSVQIAFGKDQNDVFSISTGTFTLEKTYQTSKDFATNEEYSEMHLHIRDALTMSDVPKPQLDVLVMGSNCMEDFIHSSLSFIGTKDYEMQMGELKVVKLEAIEDLYNKIISKRYLDLAEYFPQNRMFMYGADKALLNLIQICKYLGVDKVLPTNESLSTSVINLLLSNPKVLESFNMQYTNIG